MARIDLRKRLQTLLRAWPWPGAFFLLIAFLVTLFWFLTNLLSDLAPYHYDWFEPLSALIGGLGAFIVAAVLILRRVDQTEAKASEFHLSLGLATGYYYNFVQPLMGVLRDGSHPVHHRLRLQGVSRIAGLLVGFPQTRTEFEPASHGAFLAALAKGPGPTFALSSVSIEIADRPRPIQVNLAVNEATRLAVLVDIPTTLVVIPKFAEHVAKSEPGVAEDDITIEGREQTVMAFETDAFARRLLEQFELGLLKSGTDEAPELSPVSLLHVVPLNRLRHRLSELTAS